MSVDYIVNYGIGYEVDGTCELHDTEELEDGLAEYIDNEIGEGFDCFEVGSAWTGEIEGVYLTVEEPFKCGLDLTEAKEKLDAELERLGLKPVSEFGEVGGLFVC